MMKLVSYLPALLLAAISINQLILANFFNLSPWLGGGYGMFSTSDVGNNRHIHVYARSESIIKEIILPSEMNYLALKIQSFPTESNLNFLAKTVAKQEADNTVDSIEIQVWKSYFKPYTLEPSGKMLVSYSLRTH